MGRGDSRGPQRSSKTKPRVSRTRTGCWTCRDRSVKCDEQQPRCGKCQKSGLSCQWGVRLQWIEDSDAKGICHGREGVWSNNGQSDRNQKLPRRHQPQQSVPASVPSAEAARFNDTTFFLNTFARDIQQYFLQEAEAENDMEDQIFDSPHVARFKSTVTLPNEVDPDGYYPSILRAPNCTGLLRPLAESDSYVLNYFNHVVCSSTTLFDDSIHNPFRYLIIPMATSSHTILNAILAVGAAKLAFRDPRYRHSAILYHHRLLTDLKASLGSLDESSGLDTQHAEVLAGTLMLCWHDISDFCRPSWIHHLSGLCALFQDYDNNPSYPSLAGHNQRLVNFCRQYLVYHIIMAKATFRLDTLMPHAPSILPNLLQSMTGDETKSNYDDDEIEPHQGFSNSLLFLINDISDLSDLKRPGGTHQEQILIREKVSLIERSLKTLNQRLPSSFAFSSQHYTAQQQQQQQQKGPPNDTRLKVIESTAEANRLAALLFVDQTCRLNFPNINPSCKKDQPTIVGNILSLSESICDSGFITAALPIWPAFMAGCVLNTERDRLRLLNIFDRFQEQKRYGSVPPACAVLETIWRQRDLQSDENPRKPPPTATATATPTHYSRQKSHPSNRNAFSTTQNLGASPSRYPWEEAMLMSRSMVLSLT